MGRNLEKKKQLREDRYNSYRPNLTSFDADFVVSVKEEECGRINIQGKRIQTT